MTLSRRSFLTRAASVLAAPAVLTLGAHMPVSSIAYDAPTQGETVNIYVGDLMVSRRTGLVAGVYHGNGWIIDYSERPLGGRGIFYHPALHRKAKQSDFNFNPET